MLLAGSTIAAAPTAFLLWWQRRQEPSSSVSRMSCRRLGLPACRTQPTMPVALSFRGKTCLRWQAPQATERCASWATASSWRTWHWRQSPGCWRECPYCAAWGWQVRQATSACGRKPSSMSRTGSTPACTAGRSAPWQARHNALECRVAAGAFSPRGGRPCRPRQPQAAPAGARGVRGSCRTGPGRAGPGRMSLGWKCAPGCGDRGSRGSGGNPDQPSAAARHGAEPPDRRRPNHDSRRKAPS